MTFFALLAALLIEQARPLREANQAALLFTRYALWLERSFNAGQYRHGLAGWLLAVLPLVMATGAIGIALGHLSAVAGWVWSIAVLYLTMGFRQFSHTYTDIVKAMRAGEAARARALLQRWMGAPAGEFSDSETARVTIELGLAGAHRHVFGPIAWFMVLGPAGAMLYRLATLLENKWGQRTDAEFGEFGRFAARAHYVLEWIPVRVTALSFAAVGNFVDAVDCWRTQARAWKDEAVGILLAAGGGALGVRLGDSLHQNGSVGYRPELGGSGAADVDDLEAAVGLIWRSLVLWMFLLLLVTVARAFG